MARGLVSIDPQASPRQRRFDQQVRDLLNALLRSGVIRQSGANEWTIDTLVLASPSGLELTGGALRIDLDTSILTLHANGLRFAAQAANVVLAGPAAGANAVPTFRAVVTADLPNDVVTYPKIQNVSAASKLLGRGQGGGAGDVEEIGLGGNLSMTGTTLNVVGGGGGSGGGLDPITSIYQPFTAGANDDEFDNGSFSGWTAVNSGSHVPTVTETNHVASVYLPGSHPAGELAAYVKAVTPTAGQSIEIGFRGLGKAGGYHICGLIMADGATYGSGVQVLWYYSPQEQKMALNNHSSYHTLTTFNPYDIQQHAPYCDMFMRLEYDAANTWKGWVSPDGVSWVDVTGGVAYTMSPTHVGFFVTTWGSAEQFVWSLRYFKFNP